MKNQKQAEVMSPTAEFFAVQTNDALSLLFSIGTNGVFYLIRQAPGSDSGWVQHDLSSALASSHEGADITAKTFAVSEDPNTGKIDLALAVTVGDEDYLYLSIGNSTASAAWKDGVTWQAIPYDDAAHPLDKLVISDIYLAQSRSQQFIIVDVERDPSSVIESIFRYFVEPSTKLTGQHWNPHDVATDLDAGTIHSCMGRKARQLVDGVYTLGEIQGTTELLYTPVYNVFAPTNAPSPSRLTPPADAGAASAVATEGPNTTLFITGSDGLYYYPPSGQDDGDGAVLLLSSQLFAGARSLQAHATDSTVEIWGLNHQGDIFYTRCALGHETDPSAWSAPIPIWNEVEQIATYVNRVDQGSVIFAHVSGRELIRLTKNPQGSWESTQILLPTTNTSDVLQFESYTTRISLADDESHLPVANTAIDLRASSRCSVYLNGVYHVLSPELAVSVESDETGVITIVHETSSIGSVNYQAMIPGTSATLDINPMSTIVTKLEAVKSGAELAAIEVADGHGGKKPLVGANISNKQEDATARALQQFVALSKTLPADGSSHAAAQNKPRAFGPDAAVDEDSIWGVSLRGDSWEYTHGHATITAHGPILGSIGEAIDVAAGDLFSWLEHGAEDVGSFLVVEADGLYHFVIELENVLYRAALDTVQDVMQAVQWVFDEIEVAFEHLVPWLGFVFDWSDILRTHRVLKNIIIQSLRGIVTDLDGFKRTLANLFEQIEDRIGELSGLEGLAGSISSAAGASHLEVSPQADWGNHHLSSGLASASTKVDLPQPGGSTLERLLHELGTAIEAEEEMVSAAVEVIRTQVAEQIATLSAGELIRRIIGVISEVLVGSVENILLTSIDVMEIFVSGMIDLLDAAIDIPVISWLYEQISGEQLSVLDAVCLVAAIPGTIVYKAIGGAAPFPDDSFTQSLIDADSVARLRALYRDSSTRSPQGAAQQPMASGQMSNAVRVVSIVANIIAGFSAAPYILTTVVVSAIPPGDPPAELGPQLLHFSAFLATTTPTILSNIVAVEQSWDVISGEFLYGLTVGQKFVDLFPIPGWDEISKGIDLFLGAASLVPAWVPVYRDPSALPLTSALAYTGWNANRCLSPLLLAPDPRVKAAAIVLKLVCIDAHAVGRLAVAGELIAGL